MKFDACRLEDRFSRLSADHEVARQRQDRSPSRYDPDFIDTSSFISLSLSGDVCIESLLQFNTKIICSVSPYKANENQDQAENQINKVERNIVINTY